MKVRPRGGQNVNCWPLTYTLGGEGHGVQGQICKYVTSWPQLGTNRFLPLLATQIPTLWIHTSGGRGSSDIISMSSIRPICKCRCPPLPLSYLLARWPQPPAQSASLHWCHNLYTKKGCIRIQMQLPSQGCSAVPNKTVHSWVQRF
jgi:hypothetical protein